jgi:5'-nucleotidase
MEESGNYSRRRFLRTLGGAGLLLAGSASFPPHLLASKRGGGITILHTNDTHSRIDPFPAGDPKFPGMGGVARRAELIRKIRTENEHVLLLDSGDFFQGTPYFNLFGGEVELKAMSEMRYDAATLGNHDFDNGADGLARQMIHANFPMLNCNYRFEDSPLHKLMKPWQVFRKGPFRVGVFGIGIDLEGLVSFNMTQGVLFTDPIAAAQKTASFLKLDQRCHLVICLSHLGYRYGDKKVSDTILAGSTRHIDLILGGHTHTFLDAPIHEQNLDGKQVLITQSGWGGVRLGRIDIGFDDSGKKNALKGSTVNVS